MTTLEQTIAEVLSHGYPNDKLVAKLAGLVREYGRGVEAAALSHGKFHSDTGTVPIDKERGP